MKPILYLEQTEIDAIPIDSVRTYADQPDIDAKVLLMQIALAATDGVGGGGGSLPSGGIRGQLLVKQSAVNGAALWEDLILSAGGA